MKSARLMVVMCFATILGLFSAAQAQCTRCCGTCLPLTQGAFVTLHAFSGGADGNSPGAGLVRDASGNLYGTTLYGGNGSCETLGRRGYIPGCGVIFMLDASGTESVPYSFPDLASGRTPVGGLVLDGAGNIFGTTSLGGAHDSGTVFKLGSVLYSFVGQPDGSQPFGSLIQDPSGNFYGTTAGGGTSDNGTVFELDSSGNETVLYSFAGSPDGAEPSSTLVRDTAGNLYGTTVGGGASGNGTVFTLDATGKEAVLYSFSGGADGASPISGLLLDSAGDLYGTTAAGGSSGHGTVFKLDASGKETVLYSFSGGNDGAGPSSSLVQDAAGNLYGTTLDGGGTTTCGGFGCGTVFKVDPSGNESVLYAFAGGPDGTSPTAGLLLDGAGNLYGTAIRGGDLTCNSGYGCGTVFTLSVTGVSSFTVSVGLAGSGSGTVTSDPAGINCGTACSASFGRGSSVTLTATPAAGSTFAGWSGSCSGMSACTVVVNTPEFSTATFNLPPPPDFSLSSTALTPSTLSPGGSSTSTLNIAATGGFSGSVSFSCSVQPSPALAPGCSITPGSTAPGTPAKLTVSTTASTASAFTRLGSGCFYAVWLPLMGLVAGVRFSSNPPRKKRLPPILACTLFAGLLFGVACGGSSSSGGGSGGGAGGTPAGTYTITIAGTSGSLQHSITTTLTVQ